MSKGKIFMIMPFTDDFFESYEMLKTYFAEDFEFSHAGAEDNQQNILADIIPPIYNSDVIIADLTELNPNVMYELGIAHGFNKKTIIITRDDLSKLPFDLKQYRAKNYSTHFKKFNELLEYLQKNLAGAIDGDVIFSNPVKDFMDKNSIDIGKMFENRRVVTTEDKGFLDFLADIEENTVELTKKIENMTSNMNTMSEGISKSNAEVERVNKTGGSGTAAFARKETKKAAKFVDTFSKQLSTHNTEYSALWNEIERDILGLIENKYTSTDENKTSFVEYLKALYNMKQSIIESNQSISSLKESMHDTLGLERSMNQAIRFAEENLTTYIDTTTQMIASIDRIIDKSKFIVGEIDFEMEESQNG